MLTEKKLENLILKYDIPYNHNIALGRQKNKKGWGLPDELENAEEFEHAEYFYVYFSEEGFYIFPVLEKWNAGEPLGLAWDQVKRFEVKKGMFGEDELKFSAEKAQLRLKLVKRMADNSWVRENAIFLDSVNYYCQ